MSSLFSRYVGPISLVLLMQLCPSLSSASSQVLSLSVPGGHTCPWNMLLKADLSLSSWISQGSPTCMPAADETSIFCLYTNPSFADNRGIVYIANPRTASASLISNTVSKNDHAHSAKSASSEASPGRFEQQSLAGRGTGIVAVRTINQGEMLFNEAPVYFAESSLEDDTVPTATRTILQNLAMQYLSLSTAEEVQNLHKFAHMDTMAGILNANAFSTELAVNTSGMTATEEVPFQALFPNISRINHDCRPNAVYYFNASSFTQFVFAARTIHPGEEVTITYHDPFESAQARHELLRTTWDFECACSLCSGSASAIIASDSRINTILELEHQLINGEKHSAHARLDMALLLKSLLDQERVQNFMVESYAYLAQAYLDVHRPMLALQYAHLGIAASLISGLEDSPEVHSMRGMLTQLSPT